MQSAGRGATSKASPSRCLTLHRPIDELTSASGRRERMDGMTAEGVAAESRPSRAASEVPEGEVEPA